MLGQYPGIKVAERYRKQFEMPPSTFLRATTPEKRAWLRRVWKSVAKTGPDPATALGADFLLDLEEPAQDDEVEDVSGEVEVEVDVVVLDSDDEELPAPAKRLRPARCVRLG